LRRIWGGRGGVGYPALGQQTLALPHAVMQLEQPKAGVIAGGGLNER
jgi:hypothetical protein